METPKRRSRFYFGPQALSFDGILNCTENESDAVDLSSNVRANPSVHSSSPILNAKSNISLRSVPLISPRMKPTILPCSSPCNLYSKSKDNLVSPKLMKSTSNYDMDAKKTPKTRLRRTGSKHSSKSTLCLTQSLSINLETFRLTRNDSNRSQSRGSSQKMSTNEVIYGQVSAQTDYRVGKQSSVDKESDLASVYDAFDLEANSVDEIATPQQVRRVKYVNGCPVNEFIFTFEEEFMNIPSVYGQLKMKFQFINESDEFRVTVLKGCNVARQSEGTLGIYSKLCLMPGKVQVKCGSDKHDTHDPVFYETFVFRTKLDDLLNRDLKIKLYNKPGIFSVSKPVGDCLIHLYNYDLTSSTVIWQNLKKCKDQQDDMDDFDFTPLERNSFKKKKGINKWCCGLARQ